MHCKLHTILFFLTCCLLINPSVFSQETKSNPAKLNLGVDLMSRYVWRGLDYGASPNVQPTLSLSKGNFEVGYWGAISTRGTYSETDLYAKYTLKGFSIIATDYFFPVDMVPCEHQQKYFNYDNHNTGHVCETALQYKGPENFPISLYASTMVYGADKKIDKIIILPLNGIDTTYKNNYSTYFEAGYSAVLGDNNLDLFMGFTPDEGFYGTSAGIVNLGLTAYRKIKITDRFELPLKASLITNPQTENIYFIVGVSF